MQITNIFTKTAMLSISLLLFTGCATSSTPKQTKKPIKKKILLQKVKEKKICANLDKPAFISFKQLAFSVAKKENIRLGNIADFYFFDKKFDPERYKTIPEMKLDLEEKHNVDIEVLNYALGNRDVDILSRPKNEYVWFLNATKKTIAVLKGEYTIKEICKNLSNLVGLKLDDKFLNIKIVFNKDIKKISALSLINIITKKIAQQYNYDFSIENNQLVIKNVKRDLIVKKVFTEPFVYMLKRYNIYYQKTDNRFVIKDSFYKYWYAKHFLQSLNLSEDRFTFCVNINGDEVYGNFSSNEKIVLKDIGKIQLVDYGGVYDGKIRYKLKVENSKNRTKEEYIIYNSSDSFSTQLNSKAVIKIRLF